MADSCVGVKRGRMKGLQRITVRLRARGNHLQMIDSAYISKACSPFLLVLNDEAFPLTQGSDHANGNMPGDTVTLTVPL